MEGLSLAGQGEDLPESFQYRAQWLLKGALFIFESDMPRASGPRPFAYFEDAGGIDVAMFEAAFGLSTEEVFAHNMARTLLLIRAEDTEHLPTGGWIKGYIFGIGDKRARIVMERGPFGHA